MKEIWNEFEAFMKVSKHSTRRWAMSVSAYFSFPLYTNIIRHVVKNIQALVIDWIWHRSKIFFRLTKTLVVSCKMGHVWSKQKKGDSVTIDRNHWCDIFLNFIPFFESHKKKCVGCTCEKKISDVWCKCANKHDKFPVWNFALTEINDRKTIIIITKFVFAKTLYLAYISKSCH